MEGELKALKEVGAGIHFQAMPLPEGMAPTSAEVIASLNEHLVQVLQVPLFSICISINSTVKKLP